MPVDVAFMQTLCEGVHQQGGGDTDIEALRETMHRNLHVHVGMFESIVGETGFLGAENHGYRLVEGKSVEAIVILMRTCGSDFISFAVKIVESLRCVELICVVSVKIQPFARTNNNVGVNIIDPFVLNDVDVLNASEVATAQYGTCVM